MQILITSDVFPPGSVGGAAWSSATLAQSLQAAGHAVRVVVPVRQMPASAPLPVPVCYHRYHAPAIPFVQNWLRHERLWQPLAATLLAQARQMGGGSVPRDLVIHAQHVQVAPAAVLAGQASGAPVVITVRDHWYRDYFATGLHANRIPYALRAAPHRQVAALLTDLVLREGAVRGMLAAAGMPYMRAHLQRRQAYLARAQAVVAVSGYMARHLHPLVAAERLHVIPNMVDLATVQQIAHARPQHDLPPQFLLFIGKLEQNKGAGMLPAVLRALPPTARATLPPLLIAGTGALQPALARDLAALGVTVQFLQWVPHNEMLRLLARCTVLLFPSVWGEPLSRVLLEALALGTPVVAMPTGGTPEIIRHGTSGLLVADEAAMAAAVLHLLHDHATRARLADGARATAQQHYSVTAVLPRVEQLYRSLL